MDNAALVQYDGPWPVEDERRHSRRRCSFKMTGPMPGEPVIYIHAKTRSHTIQEHGSAHSSIRDRAFKYTDSVQVYGPARRRGPVF